MLPNLSVRAEKRCETHILRHFPAWKQVEIRLSVGEDSERDRMQVFIGLCKEHLTDLKAQIGQGGTPCIDMGWPDLDAEPETEVEPQIVEVEVPVEVPVERIVEKIVYRDPPAESTLRKAEAGLEAAQAKLAARDKTDVVPDELQEHVKEGETVAEAKVRFLVLYRDLGNKIMMGRAEKHEIRLHESLSAKMNWITGD